MKYVQRMLLVVLIVAGVTVGASAQHTRRSETLGVGVIVGSPATGLSAEYWLGGGVSVDAAIAWSFVGNTGLYIHGDILYHILEEQMSFGPTLAPYVGGGASITLADDANVALRLPVGANMLFNSVPLGVFLEVVPNFTLLPSTGFDFGAAAGVRFYF